MKLCIIKAKPHKRCNCNKSLPNVLLISPGGEIRTLAWFDYLLKLCGVEGAVLVGIYCFKP